MPTRLLRSTSARAGAALGWLRTREGFEFSCLLALGLLVRLTFLPYGGSFSDLQDHLGWGIVWTYSPLHVYSVGQYMLLSPSGFPPNYPPLMLYIYGVLAAVYFGAAHLLGVNAPIQVTQSPTLAVFMKLPGVVADLATTSVIYAIARRILVRRGALLASALYLFSPAVLLDSAIWGQTDGIPEVAIVLSFLFAIRRHPVRAGTALGIVIMLKPQPVIFVPVLLVYLWRCCGASAVLRAAGAMASTCLVVCLPYLLPLPRPEILALFDNMASVTSGFQGTASVSAFNLWWFVGASDRASAPLVGPLSPNIIGTGLFSVIMLVALVALWRHPSPGQLFLSAAIAAVGFFALATLQRERYLYQALALLLVAAIFDRRQWIWYCVATITTFLNAGYMAVLASGLHSETADTWRTILRQHVEITLAIGAVNLWLVGVVTILAVRSALHVRMADT